MGQIQDWSTRDAEFLITELNPKLPKLKVLLRGLELMKQTKRELFSLCCFHNTFSLH